MKNVLSDILLKVDSKGLRSFKKDPVVSKIIM